MRKHFIWMLIVATLALLAWMGCGLAEGSVEGGPATFPQEDAIEERAVSRATLLEDLVAAREAMDLIDEDLEALEGDEMSAFVAEKWQEIYLNPDFHLYLNGKDDPAELPISGKHAFVVLGFALEDGEMTQELKERCDAAAAAARAFPGSILVCSGGATGDNNPEKHTEAGLMKAYLVEEHGIAPERIFTDERAMTTLDNALYAFEILKAQDIEAITIVTSSYHQPRAQMLYETLAAFMRKTEGWDVAIQGNFGCEREAPETLAKRDPGIAAMQLNEMLNYLYSGQTKVKEIVVNYGAFGDEAEARNEELLRQLEGFNPDAAARWRTILALWKRVNAGMEIHEGVLPDGLPDSDELCIVALGFQLNPDGSMREELIHRLEVVRRSAEKYPKALIVCTGGGTAAGDETATEAGRMAEWLAANGIDESRIIVEDQSLTTAQNAQLTLGILEEQYPQVTQLAILSSDYHIATGTLLFTAESILRAEEAGQEPWTVVSNAAYKAPSGSLSSMFQAGALIELLGDVETAFEIYYETYDIHELPRME